MAVHDFQAQRLFVGAAFKADERLPCSGEQANYLLAVLRLKEGDEIHVFNGRDGEWLARLASVSKRGCALLLVEQVRRQECGPDIEYVFAPLKRARLDYMVQKAVEMGVSRLRPVLTHRTISERVNLNRMRANAIEAAEQCGILNLPEIAEPVKLERLLADWDPGRRLIFCDEAAQVANPVAVLQGMLKGAGQPERGGRLPVAVVIGPEGGFALEERDLLISKEFTVPISLGPRIMRADTAAVAALALVNATLGDWG